MMKTRLYKFLCIVVLILGTPYQGGSIKDASQTRLMRTMVGRNVNFTWQFPFGNNIWKTLFAPNRRSIVRIGPDSAPEYDHPLEYEDRVSLLSDGVMLKNLSQSDEGLYRTEENFRLLNHTIILSVYTVGELQPYILADEMLVTSTSTLTKIQRTIRVIAMQQLEANITLTFSNGWNTASCVNVYMCVCDVGHLPEPEYDFSLTIHVDYGFYDTQVNLPVSVDVSRDVTNSTKSSYPWKFIIIVFVPFLITTSLIVLIILMVCCRRKISKENKNSSSGVCSEQRTKLNLEEVKYTVNDVPQSMHADQNSDEETRL